MLLSILLSVGFLLLIVGFLRAWFYLGNLLEVLFVQHTSVPVSLAQKAGMWIAFAPFWWLLRIVGFGVAKWANYFVLGVFFAAISIVEFALDATGGALAPLWELGLFLCVGYLYGRYCKVHLSHREPTPCRTTVLESVMRSVGRFLRRVMTRKGGRKRG